MKHNHRISVEQIRRSARIVRRRVARLRKPCIVAFVALLLVSNAALRVPAQTANSQTPNSQNTPANSPSPTQQNSPRPQTPSQQSAPAQNPNPPHAQNPIAVDVNLVAMLATVRDKHGKLINNLTKDDFALQQDGHAQTIKYFDKETNLPLTLGLLVDTSLSQRRVLDQEKAASRTFVDHVLREDRDKAFLIHFDREVELLQELTNSRQKLEAALEQVGAPQFSQTSSSGGANDPDNNGGGRGGTRRRSRHAWRRNGFV